MGAYGPVISGVILSLALPFCLWALSKLIEEKQRKVLAETAHTRRGNIDADLRAALAEMETRLFAQLAGEVRQFHDCLDGVREDQAQYRRETRKNIEQLRHDVRHDAAAIMQPVIALINQHGERIQRLERDHRP